MDLMTHQWYDLTHQLTNIIISYSTTIFNCKIHNIVDSMTHQWYDLTHQLTRHDFQRKLRHFKELWKYCQKTRFSSSLISILVSPKKC